jgi:predicted enzyme related to lactoylglutathione lyase
VKHLFSHFEISGENLEILITFYSEVFGWRFERAPGVDEYWLIHAAPLDKKSVQFKPVNGGITRAKASDCGLLLYFSVESVNESLKKIEELGGKVLISKQEVQDMGWFAKVEDPEGNSFAIWQDMF